MNLLSRWVFDVVALFIMFCVVWSDSFSSILFIHTSMLYFVWSGSDLHFICAMYVVIVVTIIIQHHRHLAADVIRHSSFFILHYHYWMWESVNRMDIWFVPMAYHSIDFYCAYKYYINWILLNRCFAHIHLQRFFLPFVTSSLFYLHWYCVFFSFHFHDQLVSIEWRWGREEKNVSFSGNRKLTSVTEQGDLALFPMYNDTKKFHVCQTSYCS